MRAQRAEGLQDRASLYAGQAPGGPSHCSPFLTVLRPKSSLPPALKHRTPFLLRGKAMTCARPKSAHVISCMAHRLQTPFPHPPSLAGSLQPLPSTDFKAGPWTLSSSPALWAPQPRATSLDNGPGSTWWGYKELFQPPWNRTPRANA